MASVCINNVGMSPENFFDCPPVQPSHGWLSPRVSFSRDLADDDGGKNGGEKSEQDESVVDFVDFEFRLNDPETMISADELFSDGKLVPLHLVPIQASGERELEVVRTSSIHSPDHLYSFSPKPPRCSGVWKELLGLKKAQSIETERQKAASASSKVSNSVSLKHFLRRNSRSPSIDSAFPCSPLPRDSDSESVFSARASLSSSSSSGADHDDLNPRLSLDSDKISPVSTSLCRNPSRAKAPQARTPAFRRLSGISADGKIATMRIGLNSIRWNSESELESCDDFPAALRTLADSPRLNASGKVVFHGLGRSSSSPSISNRAPRSRPHGMERSWSANVMFTPVLNVPVCSSHRSTAKSVPASGFGQLFSVHKREKDGSSSAKNGLNTSSNVTKTKCDKSTTRD